MTSIDAFCTELSCDLPVSKGAYKKAKERCFHKECSDRTRDNDFKLTEDWFKLDIRGKFFTHFWWGSGMGCPETTCCGCPLREAIWGQFRGGFGQPGLMGSVSAYGSVLEINGL